MTIFKKIFILVAGLFLALVGLGASSALAAGHSKVSQSAPANAFNGANFSKNSSQKKILFIGNSLTGGNNLPGLFRTLAAKNSKSLYVEAHIEFGRTLRDHLGNADLQSSIKKLAWDVVVFQEYSIIPLLNENAFLQSVVDLKSLLISKNTTILLFQNWPVKDAYDGAMAELNSVYARVASETGARVVPIGRAFDYLKQTTTLPFYTDDKHPTPLATYLTALMFLDAVFGINPVGVEYTGSKQSTPAYTDGPAPRAILFNLDAHFTKDALRGVQEVARAHGQGKAPNLEIFQFGWQSKFAF